MTTPIRILNTSAGPAGHAHEADLEACLDFINSRELEDGLPTEHIPTVDDAIAYFVQRGLGHEDQLRAQAGEEGPGWLERLYAMRAAMREVWDAQVEQRTPGQPALDAVNGLLRDLPRTELVAGPGGVGVGHRHVCPDPTGEALACVVEPLVDAIAAGDTARFRICANDGCRWVFVDTSRAGRRRWCTMQSCGNRAKVARFRTRRKASQSGADEDSDAPLS